MLFYFFSRAVTVPKQCQKSKSVSYETDLNFWNYFEREIHILQLHYTRQIYILGVILEGEILSFTQINGQSSMAEGCKVQSSAYTVLYWLFVHSVCSHDLVNSFVFISILVLCISMSTVYIFVICPSFSNKFAPKCSQLHNMFSSTSCEWVVWLWMKWGIHAYFIIL